MHTSDEMQSDATTTCWVNGKLQRHISVSNRGLRYGDGLFETMAIRDGRHWTYRVGETTRQAQNWAAARS
ncbi:MAG: hypothetical protein ACRESC_07560 [Gammaproteobacteria bacterium]